jgi:hypothetical protein
VIGLGPVLLGAGKEGIHQVLQKDAGLLPARPKDKARGKTASHGAKWYTTNYYDNAVYKCTCEFLAWIQQNCILV